MTEPTTATTDLATRASSPYRQLTFDSDGTECDAWHFPAADGAPRTTGNRPCVVMAHGLAGTKDSGLRPFAGALTAAGLHVLAFDYRGFGASAGTARQAVSVRGQVDDYRAALCCGASPWQADMCWRPPRAATTSPPSWR